MMTFDPTKLYDAVKDPANLAFNSLQLHGGGYYSIGINAHDIMVDGGSVDIRADLAASGKRRKGK